MAKSEQTGPRPARSLEEIVAEHPLPWEYDTTYGPDCGEYVCVATGKPVYLSAEKRIDLHDAAPAMALAIRALLRHSSRQFAQGPQADLFRAIRDSLPEEFRP